jgi:D-sedoheptulose 7-phosphate isomerase
MSREEVEATLAEHAALMARVARELTPQIEALAGAVLGTLRGGGKVLLCGNGGSAADAQHLAAELVIRLSKDRQPLAAIALTADSSVLTAGGNDLGFAHVFERQVRALGRPGDLLILLSTSGRSENLRLAAAAARDVGVRTTALLARGGGPLCAEVDLPVVVPTESTARAQEAHITIGHIVCEIVDGSFSSPGA